MTLQTRKPVFDRPFHRANHTFLFVQQHLRNTGTILDIGDKNYVGQYVSKRLNMDVVNTESDLNWGIYPTWRECNIVFCFEVIEHLMNPLLFMMYLHHLTAPDVQVFLSYPARPKILWNNKDHFHEYDSLRFKYLLDKSGWEIVHHDKIRILGEWWDWFKYFKGFRPLLRLFYDFTQIYELRKI